MSERHLGGELFILLDIIYMYGSKATSLMNLGLAASGLLMMLIDFVIPSSKSIFKSGTLLFERKEASFVCPGADQSHDSGHLLEARTLIHS